MFTFFPPGTTTIRKKKLDGGRGKQGIYGKGKKASGNSNL